MGHGDGAPAPMAGSGGSALAPTQMSHELCLSARVVPLPRVFTALPDLVVSRVQNSRTLQLGCWGFHWPVIPSMEDL